MSTLIFMAGMLMTVAGGLWAITRWDKLPKWCVKHWLLVAGCGLWEILLVHTKLVRCSVGTMLMLGVFAGCMLLAVLTDSAVCVVYNFVWWIALCAGGCLWFTNMRWAEGFQAEETVRSFCLDAGIQLLLYVLLQFLVFGRTYGRADSYAFCTCALVGTTLGMGLEEYLTHMILSYLFLIMVQALQRNISRRGNLKRPVPFLPYINVAFWTTFFLRE